MRALDPERLYLLALSFVPTEAWLPDERHNAGEMMRSLAWLRENNLTLSEVRRALARMDPVLVRRLLHEEGEQVQKQKAIAYMGLLEAAARHGEIPNEAVFAKLLAFEGAA